MDKTQNKIKILGAGKHVITINRDEILERYYEIKNQIKELNDEAEILSRSIISMIDVNEGKIECGSFSVSLVNVNTYEFSEKIKLLEKKRDELEDNITKKKKIEIISGAKVAKVRTHIRLNKIITEE